MAGSSKPSRTPLSGDEVRSALADLPDWTWEADKLQKTYTFGSFREAVSFLVRIGFEAEGLDHHPELFNVYNTVRVGLTTHDAGNRVTGLDTELARRIDHIAWV